MIEDYKSIINEFIDFRMNKDKNIQVYYDGQKVLDINTKNNTLEITNNKFTVSGQKNNYRSFKDFLESKKEFLREEYKDVFKIIMPKYISIIFRPDNNKSEEQANYTNLLKIFDKYKSYLNQQDIEKFKENFKTYKDTKIRLNDLDLTMIEYFTFAYDLAKYTAWKKPFAVTQIKPNHVYVNIANINNIRDFCNDIKNPIDRYNITVGKKDEKLFQESLFNEYNTNIINEKLRNEDIRLIPFEEEFVCSNIDVEIPIHKDCRIDNVYINAIDRSLCFMEVKYDTKVITTTEEIKNGKLNGNPGIRSHLRDIYYIFATDKNKVERDNRVSVNGDLYERLLNKNSVLTLYDKRELPEYDETKKVSFIIMCGYSNESDKKLIEDTIALELASKSPLEENPKSGIDYMELLEKNGIKVIIYTALVDDVKSIVSQDGKSTGDIHIKDIYQYKV